MKSVIEQAIEPMSDYDKARTAAQILNEATPNVEVLEVFLNALNNTTRAELIECAGCAQGEQGFGPNEPTGD